MVLAPIGTSEVRAKVLRVTPRSAPGIDILATNGVRWTPSSILPIRGRAHFSGSIAGLIRESEEEGAMVLITCA